MIINFYNCPFCRHPLIDKVEDDKYTECSKCSGIVDAHLEENMIWFSIIEYPKEKSEKQII